MNKLLSYIKLMRIHQWIKNIFIFSPLFFAFRLTDMSLYISCIWAFIGFSFIASSIYIINDWCDIESDKQHPKKKFRPLASGAVSKKEAFFLILFLLGVGFTLYTVILDNIYATILLASYFILNIGYSLKLKHIPILDISIVAIGFVIRVFVGGLVTDTPLSQWIIIMTFLLALLLALGKRRDDVLIFEKTGNKARRNLDGYNLAFINAAIVIVTAVVTVSYIMYTLSPETMLRNSNKLYLTSFFVILGLLRYLQITFVEEKSGDPTKIFLKDIFLHSVLIGWAVTFFIISFIHR